MSSGGFAKVKGTHKKIMGAWGKVDGEWKKVTDMYGKSDEWKETWKNAYAMPSFLTYPSIITRGDRITWNCEDIPGAHYEYQERYNSGPWSSSKFSTSNAGQTSISTNTSRVTYQARVRAVAPSTRDKASSWRTGPVRSLAPQKLDEPTITYSSSITRGDRVRLQWSKSSNTTYTVQAVYKLVAGYNNYITVYTGESASEAFYNVSGWTGNEGIQFRVKASRSGYYESEWAYGPDVTLGNAQLATVSNISVPNVSEGQTVTISWGSVNHAQKYQLEVFYSGGTWTRLYWGSNRSASVKINGSGDYIQFRVRATAIDYKDGDWKNSETQRVGLPPLKKSVWGVKDVDSWTEKYGGVWEQKDPYEQWMFQGSWTEKGEKYGNYRGIAYMDYASIQKTLQGRYIDKVRLYMYRLNRGGYPYGQKINLYTHNYASRPSGEPQLRHLQGPFQSFPRGEGKYVTVDKELVQRIVEGKAKGFAFYMQDGSNYLYISDSAKMEVYYR